MANLSDDNGRRYKRHPVDQRYMVDSGHLYGYDIYQGNDKPERPMIYKLIIALWYGVGLPCWLWSVCIYLFHWFHIDNPREFVTLMVSVILGVSKAAVLWAEKGDKVWFKIKRLFTRKQKRYIKRKQ